MTERHDPDPAASLPRGLQQKLEEEYGASVEIPAERDSVILAAARAALVHGRWRRDVRRWVLRGTVAAGILLAVGLLPRVWERPRSQPAVAWREDVDGSGHVDILDAFVLRRALESGEVRPDHDVNSDGIVDQRDVDHVAQRAVRIE